LRILLVTGYLGEKIIREILVKNRFKHEVEVVTLPVQVISMLSTRDIAHYLEKMSIDRKSFDLVIIPGLCRGSCRDIEERTGLKCVKGTIHAHDLPLILSLDNPLEVLSPDHPADDVLKERVRVFNIELLRKIEESCTPSFNLGGLCIPSNPPPLRIIGEISITGIEPSILEDRVRDFIENGVDIISISSELYSPDPDGIYRVARLIKERFDIPLAIDTLSINEMQAGVRAGVDLILSIDRCLVDKVSSLPRDIGLVAIPYDSCESILPLDHGERIRVLRDLVVKLENMGFNKIIGDLVLDPPVIGDVLESIYAYRRFKTEYRDIPLMMGVGNVTELMDVDSIGVNATLIMLGLNAGISLYLVVEKSVKAKGSIRESVIAKQMMELAWFKKQPPKDLGIDLLVLKDKRRTPISFQHDGEVIYVEGYSDVFKPDPTGYFKIWVDHDKGVVNVQYNGVKGRVLFKGRDVKSILKYIIDNNYVSDLKHAAYLGYELSKAEQALITGKNYVQDMDLFTVKKPFIVKKSSKHF